MKPGGLGLNPNAAAYVPVSKRDDDSENPNMQNQPYDGSGSQVYMPKTATSSEKQMSDEDELEMEMDIEFLLAGFSNLSYESIKDVYLANNCDLEATSEMLNQLEIFSAQAEDYLPDTLDIGDVPTETIEPSSAPKQKSESTEASASTSSNAPVSSS